MFLAFLSSVVTRPVTPKTKDKVKEERLAEAPSSHRQCWAVPVTAKDLFYNVPLNFGLGICLSVPTALTKHRQNIYLNTV